jgi:hypothetical protein
MFNKCIRYFVDPQALKDGVSIECLDKHNIEELKPDLESQLKAMSWKKNKNNCIYS